MTPDSPSPEVFGLRCSGGFNLNGFIFVKILSGEARHALCGGQTAPLFLLRGFQGDAPASSGDRAGVFWVGSGRGTRGVNNPGRKVAGQDGGRFVAGA